MPGCSMQSQEGHHVITSQINLHVHCRVQTPASSWNCYFMPGCFIQSGKGHHITKSKSRVHGPLLASRGIVAAYPKAVKLSHLMSHAKHYLLHDTLLVRYQVDLT